MKSSLHLEWYSVLYLRQRIRMRSAKRVTEVQKDGYLTWYCQLSNYLARKENYKRTVKEHWWLKTKDFPICLGTWDLHTPHQLQSLQEKKMELFKCWMTLIITKFLFNLIGIIKNYGRHTEKKWSVLVS